MAIERKMRQRVSLRPTRGRWPQLPKREKGEREREPNEEDEEQ